MEATFQPGDLLAGRYRIRETLGSGTIGVVYRALDMGLNTEVALKVVGPLMLPDAAARRTFIQVVRRAQAVDHPNLARILDVRQDGEFALVASQLLEGLTLRRLLTSRREKRHRMPPEEVRPILEQVAEALTTAHPEVCHGCLKPEDIVLLPDHVKVLDLGMAAGLPRETFLAAYRQSDGPLPYLAPELRARMPVTPRADVYSLGVVVYEMLTGVAPLETPRSVRTFDETLPVAYDEIVRRALSMDPAHRYRAPEGLVADFVAVIEDRPLGPPPSGATGPLAFATPMSAPLSPAAPATAPEARPLSPLPVSEKDLNLAEDRDEAWGFTERTPAPAPPPAPATLSTDVEMPALDRPHRPTQPRSAVAPPGASPLPRMSPRAATPAPRAATPQPTSGSDETEWLDATGLSETTPPPHVMEVAASREDAPTPMAPQAEAPAAAADSGAALLSAPEPLLPPPSSLAAEEAAPAAVRLPTPPPEAAPSRGISPAPAPQKAVAEPAAGVAVAPPFPAPLPPAEVTRRVLGLRRASLAAWAAGSLAIGLIAAGLVYQVVRAHRAEEADQQQRFLFERQRLAQNAAPPQAAPPAPEPQAPPPTPEPQAPPPTPEPQAPPPTPEPQAPPPAANPAEPEPGTEPQNAVGCPESMKLITPRRGDPYCIDKYEYPGVAFPRVDVSFEAADLACAQRDSRLCTPDEWERACLGPKGAAYPYGETWDPLACNTASAEGTPHGVLNSGAQRECRSSHGIYDMSGNVAEWVADRTARGGDAQSGPDASRCRASVAGASSKLVGFRCCKNASSR